MTLAVAIGDRFGSLRVLEIVEGTRTAPRLCLCLCDCGKLCSARIPRLVSSYTQKCKWCAKRKLGLKGLEKETQLRYATYAHGAARRGYIWEISRRKFIELIQASCFYCGISPAKGVDRRNNTIGYTENNSVACCKTCNIAKNNMSEIDFFVWLRRIMQFHGEWL